MIVFYALTYRKSTRIYVLLKVAIAPDHLKRVQCSGNLVATKPLQLPSIAEGVAGAKV